MLLHCIYIQLYINDIFPAPCFSFVESGLYGTATLILSDTDPIVSFALFVIFEDVFPTCSAVCLTDCTDCCKFVSLLYIIHSER